MRITRQALDEVHRHAGEGYPYEVCGMLIAQRGEDLVTRVRRMRNTVVDRARDRYEMDVREQMQVERECDAAGQRIVGFYHSHPDHPAQASVTDAGRSWAGSVYLIVSCAKGTVVDGNAFMSDQDRGPMHQVPLQIVG
jgi:proteasome lid subunit RPN8/RPN11